MCYSQAQDILLSNPTTIQNTYSDRHNILGTYNHSVYVGFVGYDKMKPKTEDGSAKVFFIVKYDETTLTIDSRNEVPITGYPKNVFSMKGNVYLVQKCKENLCCSKINLEKAAIEITQPLFTDKTIDLINFECGITSDSNALYAVRYHIAGDGRVEVQLKIFDLNLKETFSKNFFIPFKAKSSLADEKLLFDFKVDSEMNITFSLQRKNGKSSETNARFNHIIVRYSSKTDKVTTYDVNIGNDDLTHTLFYELVSNKNTLYAYGYFSSSFTYCMDGIFYMEFDKATGEIKKINKRSFPRELTELMKKDNLTNGKKICFIDLERIYRCNDESTLFIGKIKTGGYLAGSLVMKLDKDDSLAWCTYLRRDEILGNSNIGFTWYHKFAGIHFSDSKIFFISNTQTKHYSGSDKVKADKIKEMATSFCTEIDMKTGSYTLEIMWPLADGKFLLEPESTYKISDTESLFIASNKLELVLGRIHFK